MQVLSEETVNKILTIVININLRVQNNRRRKMHEQSDFINSRCKLKNKDEAKSIDLSKEIKRKIKAANSKKNMTPLT